MRTFSLDSLIWHFKMPNFPTEKAEREREREREREIKRDYIMSCDHMKHVEC